MSNSEVPENDNTLCSKIGPTQIKGSTSSSASEKRVKYDTKHDESSRKRVCRTSTWNNRGRQRFVVPSECGKKPGKHEQFEKYIYGNFPHYYGYRNQNSPDTRLTCMNSEWFRRKSVLDIGCNAGHVTLSIARHFSPRMIIGIDIDEQLVQISKKNAKHYIDESFELKKFHKNFPISFVSLYGPIALALLPGKENVNYTFPFNVSFIQGNYVLESDELLEKQKQHFHTILCLSMTKWVHLNWGDIGIKRLFRRAYAQLKPGGIFILEAQPFSSYARKKKISDMAHTNYMSIQLFPDSFNAYLLEEVGFASCELIDIPAHSSKGFNRPIYLFTKGLTPKKEPVVSSVKDELAAPTHILFNIDDEGSSSVNELKTDVEKLSD